VNKSFYEQLPKPFFVLAPMDDVTDTVFRRVIADCAPPDLYFTEFVSVDGLQSPGRKKLLKRLKFTSKEQPLIAQIWGKSPEKYYKTAQQIADGSLAHEANGDDSINFAGVDINMGCPDKTIVKNGCCSALINNRELALEIIQATKEGAGGKLPVSVKTRLGFNEVDMTWPELLLKQDLAVLTMHGRTRKEMSLVPANWELIDQTRKLRDELAPQTKIVGNGDVMNRQHGIELAKQYQLDGIMIGRGVFHDPYAFAQSSPWLDSSKAERVALYRRHIEEFADTWPNEERRIHTLNKFCKIYINNFNGAKELREQLMRADSTDELLQILSTHSS
jgi:tRNA-dihydrouridine synthase